MKDLMLNIGYGNLVAMSRVVAVLTPRSAPMKRLREEAKKNSRLIDATQGKRTRSIIVTDSNHVILSAFTPETISMRIEATRSRRRPVKEDETSD